MSVKIYIEGGGDGAVTLSQCRAGFRRLFEKVVKKGQQPKVIACGGRDQAFKDFCTALKQADTDTVLLLVDAEGAVQGTDCWKHLNQRDKWTKPTAAGNKNVYMMVQSMESWFLADKEKLVLFYGDRFLLNSLPKAKNIETVGKKTLADKLDIATKPTQKGRYHKTQHGFQILASLDPSKIQKCSAHADRLFKFLASI